VNDDRLHVRAITGEILSTPTELFLIGHCSRLSAPYAEIEILDLIECSHAEFGKNVPNVLQLHIGFRTLPVQLWPRSPVPPECEERLLFNLDHRAEVERLVCVIEKRRASAITER